MKNFSIKARINSFKYALQGVIHFFNNEHNSWMHLSALFIVIVAGFYFNISKLEWMLIAIVSGFVIATEIVNTSIESLTDLVSPEYNKQAGKVKDIAAAAVLVAAFTALVVGGIIFIPKIIT